MARGFVYLVAVLDWFSRKVLAWRLSNTLETTPCLEALHKAIAKYGKPEIMNTDSHMMVTSSLVVWLKHRLTVRWVGAALLSGLV